MIKVLNLLICSLSEKSRKKRLPPKSNHLHSTYGCFIEPPKPLEGNKALTLDAGRLVILGFFPFQEKSRTASFKTKPSVINFDPNREPRVL